MIEIMQNMMKCFLVVKIDLCFFYSIFEKKKGKVMQKLPILILKKIVGGRSKTRRHVFKNGSYGCGNGSGGGAF